MLWRLDNLALGKDELETLQIKILGQRPQGGKVARLLYKKIKVCYYICNTIYNQNRGYGGMVDATDLKSVLVRTR